MVYTRNGDYVRAGSWGTKPAYEQWDQTMKQLKDAASTMIPRLDHLLFNEGSDVSRSSRELYENKIIYELEYLRGSIDVLLAKFPKERRARALENVTGRTPEEAAAFQEKARRIRESM